MTFHFRTIAGISQPDMPDQTPLSPSKELSRLSLEEVRSPRGSYTINADIQARLMAFQEQRQASRSSSSNHVESATVSRSQEDLSAEAERERDNFQRQQQLQRKKSLQRKQQQEKPLPPLPPKDLKLEKHGVDEECDQNPLLSLRLSSLQQKQDIRKDQQRGDVCDNEEPQEGQRPTEHQEEPHLFKPQQQSASANDVSSLGSPLTGEISSIPTLPQQQQHQSVAAGVSVHSGRPSLPDAQVPQLQTRSQQKFQMLAQQQQQQRLQGNQLNPQRPAPALPINTHNAQVSPQVAARMPKTKQSLSMRRGMKLPGGLPGATPLVSGNASADTKDDITTNSAGDSNSVSNLLSKKSKQPLQPQQQQPSLQLKGLFANFSKYIDIKSGSLNFAGKLSLDSKGINFNGTKFNISADDLEFIEELGRGNYGTVSKVLHKPTGIIMAMKEVRLELDDSKFRQILMELEVLHKCNSPYIIDFYGAFFVEGAVYMCMEFMDGGSLDRIYGDGVDEPHLKYVADSVIRGLMELKEKHNVIHRDVKPTNILVNTAGKVKLCDFGVSGNLVASLAKTNIGCQSYMAPERIKSQSPDDVAYTVQSDIWSLGLSILETAKGCYPYPPETFNNIFSQLSAIVDGEPPKLPDGFSPLAHDFIAHCLDKIPERRPNYAQLLKHPWFADMIDQAEMSHYVKLRIKEAKQEKTKQDKEDFKQLNQKLKPPLHRGGAPKGA